MAISESQRELNRRFVAESRARQALKNMRPFSVPLDKNLTDFIDKWKVAKGHPSQSEALSDILRTFQQERGFGL